MEAIDRIVLAMREASEEERERLKQELLEMARGPDGEAVRAYIEKRMKGELLEVRWELEDVLDATRPAEPEPPAPPPPKPAEPREESPAGPVRASELETVYEDRVNGVIIRRTRDGRRWFLTQYDPYTGRARSVELSPAEVEQLQRELDLAGVRGGLGGGFGY